MTILCYQVYDEKKSPCDRFSISCLGYLANDLTPLDSEDPDKIFTVKIEEVSEPESYRMRCRQLKVWSQTKALLSKRDTFVLWEPSILYHIFYFQLNPLKKTDEDSLLCYVQNPDWFLDLQRPRYSFVYAFIKYLGIPIRNLGKFSFV